jgi:hypothetical protein
MIESKLDTHTPNTKLTYPVIMRHGSTVVLFTSCNTGTCLCYDSNYRSGDHDASWIEAENPHWTRLGPGESVTLRNLP